MYQVILEHTAERPLRRLPAFILKRIDRRIKTLTSNPRPRGVTKLRGREKEGWRIRVGDYRILYRIDDRKQIVTIYRIRHRREAYW